MEQGFLLCLLRSGNTDLRPVDGNLIDVAETLFAHSADAVLQKMIDQVIGKMQFVRVEENGLHFGGCQRLADVRLCNEQQLFDIFTFFEFPQLVCGVGWLGKARIRLRLQRGHGEGDGGRCLVGVKFLTPA